MNCEKCGTSLDTNMKSCTECGTVVSKKNYTKGFFKTLVLKIIKSPWIWWWRVSKQDIEKELDTYNDFYKSARGRSVVLIWLSFVATVLMIFTSWVKSVALVDAVLFVIIAFFVGKGRRWAMVAAMVFWTIAKGYHLLSGANVIVTILWWTIYMHVFWLAYRVETEKKKRAKVTN